MTQQTKTKVKINTVTAVAIAVILLGGAALAGIVLSGKPNTAPPVVNGTCGTAQKAYADTKTWWIAGAAPSSPVPSTVFCATGLAPSPQPAFPEIGQTSNWVCNGINGGKSDKCGTYRIPPVTNPTTTTTEVDTTPPKVTAFSITPTTISTVRGGDQIITVKTTITDDISGVCVVAGNCNMRTSLSIRSNSLPQQTIKFSDFQPTTVGGNEYIATAIFPKGINLGVWTVLPFLVSDKTNNAKGYTPSALKTIGATGLEIMNIAK